MVFPAVVYAMSQFKSMGGTIEALSDGKIPEFTAAGVFCGVMLLYEIFGGLRAIAYTDALQGLILLVSFCIFYVAQDEVFGGVAEAGKAFEMHGRDKMLSKSQMQAWVSFGMTLFCSF